MNGRERAPLEERQRLLKLVLGLARKADNQIGRNRAVRKRTSQPLDTPVKFLARVVAVHAPENGIAAALHRQMKMPCEIGKAGKPFTKRIVHRPRVEGAEPELHVRLRGQQLLQQLGERHLRLEVLAVGRDLDAGQHDLVHARVSQPRRLLERLLDRQRAHPPSRIRNDAVGAEVVAAVLDLEQRARAAVRDTGRQSLKAAVLALMHLYSLSADGLLAQVDHLRPIPGTADEVDLAGGADTLRVGLCKAAARRDNRVRIVSPQLVERADVLMVGHRCYRTGVDDHGVCVLIHDLMSARLRQLTERLRLK